ncbi:MAG TPA: DUF4870 domain-containing protein [Acidimicrobiales bacterium]|nr:DUF4870 domain-containing protein [Acidimicrobiales bacterium]
MSIEGTGAALPVPTADDRTMSMVAHLGGIVLSFIPALVVYLTKGQESPFVKDQAVEALNFQISVAIAYVVASFLIVVLIGLLLLPVVWIAATVFSIIGGLAANRGEVYRYPFNIRLVK